MGKTMRMTEKVTKIAEILKRNFPNLNNMEAIKIAYEIFEAIDE